MTVFNPELNNMSDQNLIYMRRLQQVRNRLITLLMLCALLLSATLIVDTTTQANMKYIVLAEAVLSLVMVIYVLVQVKKCRFTEMAVMTAHANKIELKQLMNYDASKYKEEITEVHIKWQRDSIEYGTCAMLTVESIFIIIVFGFLM